MEYHGTEPMPLCEEVAIRQPMIQYGWFRITLLYKNHGYKTWGIFGRKNKSYRYKVRIGGLDSSGSRLDLVGGLCEHSDDSLGYTDTVTRWITVNFYTGGMN